MRSRPSLIALAAPALALALLFAAPARPAGVSNAQERAALEFLTAAATGNAEALGASIHPDELRRLRLAITAQLQAEAATGDAAVRKRLFGDASSMKDVERLTDPKFFASLAGRLRYPARVFEKFDGLDAVPDGDKLVHVVLRGRQPEGRGETRVVVLVSLLPYGKDWKAAIPSEVEAQIEDLLDRREPYPGILPKRVAGDAGAAAAAGVGGAAPALPATSTPEMLALFDNASRALLAGLCEDYYGEYMSPNFRRATSDRAMETLVRSCNRSDMQREQLLTALELARETPPELGNGGARATFDLAGRGLRFDRFVIERIDGRWYIAE